MDVRGRWPDPDKRVSGRLHQRVWVDVPGQWIQDFQFLNPKKKKKINKSMLIHVHSEISNMFLLKGKSHFSGAVSFWRNLQSQRDRNILPKKRGQTQIPTWEKKSDTEGLCPSHTISEFPLSCTDKNESILKFVTNNKKFKIRFRFKRQPESEIVSLQDIFFDKIYNRIPIMQQSSSDSYQINTH